MPSNKIAIYPRWQKRCGRYLMGAVAERFYIFTCTFSVAHRTLFSHKHHRRGLSQDVFGSLSARRSSESYRWQIKHLIGRQDGSRTRGLDSSPSSHPARHVPVAKNEVGNSSTVANLPLLFVGRFPTKTELNLQTGLLTRFPRPRVLLSARLLVKVQHIARPSRSLLEIIKDSWIEENGSTPAGNVDDASQVRRQISGRLRERSAFVFAFVVASVTTEPSDQSFWRSGKALSAHA